MASGKLMIDFMCNNLVYNSDYVVEGKIGYFLFFVRGIYCVIYYVVYVCIVIGENVANIKVV